jgi:hypothetical protein
VCRYAWAKATGYRFGKHVGAAQPLVVALCRAASDENSEALREHCLQALELFASKCPGEAAPMLAAGPYNRPLYKPQLSRFISCYH